MAQTLKGNWHPYLALVLLAPASVGTHCSPLIRSASSQLQMMRNQLTAKSLSIFSGNHWVGFTGGFLFGMVGARGGGQEKGEMTSCSQNSLGAGGGGRWLKTEQERMCQLDLIHISIPKGRQKEKKMGFSLLWNWFYFRNLTSGRCTKKGAGISSQLVTASGNNMKISLDKWEWRTPPPYSGWSIKSFSYNSATQWKDAVS